MRLLIIPILITILFSSCGPYLNQPLTTQEAEIASKTNLEKTLLKLPKPPNPVVVAVYKFKDQTGQYKPSDVGSSFSTAVTQGGTNILIKALDDSGWFKIIERENIGNLLNERKIIRQTRMQYQGNQENQVLIDPLLFAGVIIEGGVVSYDANMMTGGIGVRYFGTGGATAYRQDRVTVYLRAIATRTGEVLKNVNTSKTILSQSLDGGVFRYVKFSRLLEAETGFTFNEPSDIAVTEAIQKAVYSLVVEGLKDGLWAPDSTYYEETQQLISLYDEEIQESEYIDYMGQEQIKDPSTFDVSLNSTAYYYQGDYPNPLITPGLNLGFHYDFRPKFGIDFNYALGSLRAQNNVDLSFNSLDLNLKYMLLGNTVKRPFLYAGPGILFSQNFSKVNVKFQTGIGFDYNLNKLLSINLFAGYNQFLRDDIDSFESGAYVDYFYNAGLGVKFHLGRKNKEEK